MHMCQHNKINVTTEPTLKKLCTFVKCAAIIGQEIITVNVCVHGVCVCVQVQACVRASVHACMHAPKQPCTHNCNLCAEESLVWGYSTVIWLHTHTWCCNVFDGYFTYLGCQSIQSTVMKIWRVAVIIGMYLNIIMKGDIRRVRLRFRVEGRYTLIWGNRWWYVAWTWWELGNGGTRLPLTILIIWVI